MALQQTNALIEKQGDKQTETDKDEIYKWKEK